MSDIIIAGATGYLGSHLVKALQKQGLAFRALARRPEKLRQQGLQDAAIITAEATRPDSLTGKLDGASILISTIGITRQRDGLTYMDVDYQANLNLLEEAQRAGIRQFVYISAINGRQMRDLKIMAAKEKFVDALKASGMDYLIIRPNGFFSDMRDFLDMAKGGRVYLFGEGQYRLNPIHGADLAAAIVDALGQSRQEITIGGPEIFSQRELGALALKAYDKPLKIVSLPDWIRRLTIKLLRTFTSVKTYGPIEFFLSMMGQDNIAPTYGLHRLETFFEEEARRKL